MCFSYICQFGYNIQLSIQSFVSVNHNKPSERLKSSVPVQKATRGTSGKSTFNNTDLPPACLPTWNSVYVPLLVDWAGTIRNPWQSHDGVDIKANFERLWEIAYPHIEVTIEPKQAVFVRVCLVE
jgi:hypothetical protein